MSDGHREITSQEQALITRMCDAVDSMLMVTGYPENASSSIALITLGVARLASMIGEKRTADFMRQYADNVEAGLTVDRGKNDLEKAASVVVQFPINVR